MEHADRLYQIIEKRRTVRKFQSKPIEQEKLRRILRAGLRAPSSNHLREWHFMLLKDMEKRKDILQDCEAFSRSPDREFLDETLKTITNEYQRAVYAYSVPLQERILLTAPVAIVVCFRMEKQLADCNSLFDLNRLASVWLAIGNILLAMTAEGIGGVTMVPFKTTKLKKVLGIPNDYEVATLIALGYPDREPEIKQIDITLDERLHIDTWK